MTGAASAALVRAIAVSTHGRSLVEAPASPGPWPMLVACHGYAENGQIQLDRLRAAPARAFELNAAHAWTDAFSAAVAAFLGDFR